ncbi:MAG TPA: hypothetical protein VMM36_13305 [Opitutaceae bacterium]|nr:hypothetical protein [Opitutaceae bacterium]
MAARRRPPLVDPAQVFLNVPYNRSYEHLLVVLTAALVAVGRVPRLTFQVPEVGEGRLRRIFSLLKSCRVSIHDLSAVGIPVRFNMPFELGLACAIKEQSGEHDFLILERKPHRLHRHLSDVGGIDPKIHNGTARGAINAILDVLERPGGNPSTEDVMRLHRHMMAFVPALKRRHGTRDLFSTRVYGELVATGWAAMEEMRLI